MRKQAFGLSYVLAVLIVLAISVAAAAIYASISQHGLQIMLNIGAEYVDKVSEKLSVIHAEKTGSSEITLVVYNYGSIPICIKQVLVVGGGDVNIPASNCKVNPLTIKTFQLTVSPIPTVNNRFKLVIITDRNNVITATGYA